MNNEKELKQEFSKAKEEIARPLSNFDIKYWLNRNGIECNIISYHLLSPNMKLRDLFSKDDCCIVLYNIEHQNTGHWCCLIRIDKDTVEFFDPYASKLDYNLRYAKNKFPTITAILKKNAIKNIVFNNMKFQRVNNAISTCGRHCAFRILHYKMSLEEYQNGFLNSGFPSKLYDYYIYLLTSDIMKEKAPEVFHYTYSDDEENN